MLITDHARLPTPHRFYQYTDQSFYTPNPRDPYTSDFDYVHPSASKNPTPTDCQEDKLAVRRVFRRNFSFVGNWRAATVCVLYRLRKQVDVDKHRGRSC